MMKFESEENNGEEAIIYPGKVLASDVLTIVRNTQ
jgi:hypothetical protein